ncbi:G-type lectin S-receptor-like serine/threonine-protein kinase [Carex littledalei]|uniref:G-type lectin S-receptor-like serine/threonine-protein kinase n=1 Tax=Carex littledalei TaxID=544730 RepID=A0A833RCC4_9POAL|nr:G-type lectin S-receptor-like serine/threonine-protein kinase [Carex littledalei]
MDARWSPRYSGPNNCECLAKVGACVDAVAVFSLPVAVVAVPVVAGEGNNRRRAVLIGIIVSATIALLLIILLAGIIFWRKVLKEDNLGTLSCSLKNTEIPLFDLVTVAASTGNFSPANELGQGAFGIVYKERLGGEALIERVKILTEQLDCSGLMRLGFSSYSSILTVKEHTENHGPWPCKEI